MLPPSSPPIFANPIDFTHPDFAMTIRMENTNAGTSRFYFSYDRGHAWRGPYRLPLFGQLGVMGRTDMIVNGPSDCHLFLTASKANGLEGRPFCARTTDGGLTWRFLSFIGPEPTGYSIMPSTVRLSATDLVTTIRLLDEPKSWIDAYASHDNGQTWSFSVHAGARYRRGQPAQPAPSRRRPALPDLRPPRPALLESWLVQRRPGQNLEPADRARATMAAPPTSATCGRSSAPTARSWPSTISTTARAPTATSRPRSGIPVNTDKY